jgi:hypothetical protein
MRKTRWSKKASDFNGLAPGRLAAKLQKSGAVSRQSCCNGIV